jgi:hypothetical protein
VLLGAPLFELKNRMLNESLQKGIAMSQLFLLIPQAAMPLYQRRQGANDFERYR